MRFEKRLFKEQILSQNVGGPIMFEKRLTSKTSEHVTIEVVRVSRAGISYISEPKANVEFSV